jgi:superfamily II DNA or RNA helicase
MAYELRPYQLESVEAVKNLKEGFNGILSLSTGTGKTVIMSAIANETLGRTLIVVQSSELRTQTIEKLFNTNPELDVGSVQASLNEVSNKVVIATRQSLTHSKSTRLEQMSEHGDFELVFFDECHSSVGQIKKIIDKLNPNIKVIGVTATAFNPEMKKVFHGIIYEKSILEMINKKYLCEPKAIYVYSDVDLSSVKTVAGEFNQRQLEDAVNTDNRNDIIVDAYLKYASDRKSTIVFASGIAHARDICQKFKDNNIICDYIDSTIEDSQRELVIDNFKSGKLPVIVNVGILTLGFDHPPVSCIMMCRPTKSKILFTQIIGRGLRTSEGKENCLVIDVVDIVRKHDLMTMTDIFGVELKDQETLSEAIEREERNVAEKVAREEIAKQKETERLKLIAESLKLFKTNMSDYFDESYYDWYRCDNNTYALSTNSDYHYVIYKSMVENTFELYFVNTTNRINTKDYISENENLIDLIEESEKYASRKYSTFLDRKAKWKFESSTQKQLEWLGKEWWAKGKVLKTKMDIHMVTKSNKITWIMKK